MSRDVDHQSTNGDKTTGVLVSVVIPVYNRTSELDRAIRSVLDQSWRNFEILVVDDGSNADIRSICDSFKDERIRYFRNEVHKNANVARNKGIKEARGEYIAMLDSDDEYLPTHLERRAESIKEWGCDGIFGSAHVVAHGGNRTQISRQLQQGELLINYLLSDGFAPTPSHFYKTSAAADTLWDETLERHQDLDFLVRFAEKFTLRIDPEPTVIIHWEYHEGKDFRLKSCMAFIERYKDDIEKRIYCDYHRNMYYKIRDYERLEYVEHYAAESYKHIQYVSLRSFISVHKKSRDSLVYLLRKFISLRLAFYTKNLHDYFYDSVPQNRRGRKGPFRDY